MKNQNPPKGTQSCLAELLLKIDILFLNRIIYMDKS